jgi:phospholipid/cholesterol/gamma-HCH transport system permease protein
MLENNPTNSDNLQPAVLRVVANNIWQCSGDWTIQGMVALEKSGVNLKTPSTTPLTLVGSAIRNLDTAGALLLRKLSARCEQAKIEIKWQGFREEHTKLLELIASKPLPDTSHYQQKDINLFAQLGHFTVEGGLQIISFFNFTGQVSVSLWSALKNPARIYWRSTLEILESSGYNALPIVGLLSFLIGLVIAYEMGIQLQTYGANIYIVDLIGISVLREFGPLITAIILAGRTGSAFTAELGTMKINEEIDALTTMGISPLQLLVLPKIFGMIMVVPLLIVWADICGVMGGMVMAQSILGVDPSSFLSRFQQNITMTQYNIGLVKAPVFAAIIAGIGCYQGFQVRMSADDVGKRTTKSVVQAIFFVIVIDAIFAIYCSWRGI